MATRRPRVEPKSQSEMVIRYRAGDYNPRNIWNTERGAVHLTHPANSLFAEVVLASDGTIGRAQIGPSALVFAVASRPAVESLEGRGEDRPRRGSGNKKGLFRWACLDSNQGTLP